MADPAKLEVVRSRPEPTNQTEVRSPCGVGFLLPTFCKKKKKKHCRDCLTIGYTDRKGSEV